MTPLPLEVKQYIRDFFTGQLNMSKHQHEAFGRLPAIIIKEVDMERFIDDLWVNINKRTITDEKA